MAPDEIRAEFKRRHDGLFSKISSSENVAKTSSVRNKVTPNPETQTRTDTRAHLKRSKGKLVTLDENQFNVSNVPKRPRTEQKQPELREKRNENILLVLKQSLIETEDLSSNFQNSELHFKTLAEGLVEIKNIDAYVKKHKNQGIRVAYQKGYCLKKIKDICTIEGKNLFTVMKNFDAKNYGQTWTYFFLNFYELCVIYPKIKKVSVSLPFFSTNFGKIKASMNNSMDNDFWKIE